MDNIDIEDKNKELDESIGIVSKEIRRQNLLRMSELSSDLCENDILFLSNRNQLDAIIIEPSKALDLLSSQDVVATLIDIIEARIKRDRVISITDRDRLILNAIKDAGVARLIEVAEAVKIESSNIHRRLKKLAKAGIIDRSEGREITYSITELGLDIIQQDE